MWYCVHAILLHKLKEEVQDRYPVWENVILIEASNPTEARDKAISVAKLDEGDDDGTMTLYGKPAERVLMGIRKIIECIDGKPEDETEVTYSTLEVSSEEDLGRLARGEEVVVLYAD